MSSKIYAANRKYNQEWLCPQKYDSHLDRVSTRRGSDLAQPWESNDRVCTPASSADL